MTRLRFLDIGGGEKAAAVHSDDGTSKVIVKKDGEPIRIRRVTTPPEPPQRQRVIQCCQCGCDLILREWNDGAGWEVAPFHPDEST
jgi:hypothetical protein